MFYNVKIAYRNLHRNGLYSVLNIAGLAVDITAATLIFLWANHLLRYNRDFPNAENIYQIHCNYRYGDKIYTNFSVAGPLSATLDESFPEVKRNARVANNNSQQSFKIENTEQFVSGRGSYADSTMFTMLRMEFVRGNPATAFVSKSSIVISETMAKRCFNDDDPIGKTLQTFDSNIFEVTGVFKDLNENCDFSYEWLIPFRVYEEWQSDMDDWGMHCMTMYVELDAHTNVNSLNQKLKPLAAEKSDGKNDDEYFVYPVTKTSLYDFQDGKEIPGYIVTIRLFLAIGAIILLIACINFMNLATARSQKRALEVGVRKTFGSGRLTLINQFMGEAGMITLAAMMSAVVLTLLCLPYFNQLVSMNLTFDFADWNNWIGLLVIGVVCSVVSGSYPSFYLSSFSPTKIFQKMKIKTAGSVVFVRKVLVIFQFATAFVLICATLVIFLQIRHGQNRDIGFDKENLVWYWVSEDIYQSFVPVRNELMASGVVENAGMSSDRLAEIWTGISGQEWQGKDPDDRVSIHYIAFSPDFVETAKLTIEEGRNFSSSDEGKNYILINRSLANLMGEAGCVGGRIIGANLDNENSYEIIGIVNDFVFNSIFRIKAQPLIINYNSYFGSSLRYLFVRLRPNVKTADALEQINNVLRQFNPNQQFDPVFMDDSLNRLFHGRFTEQKLSFLFAALAIFISCLGLFGLSSFSVEQRTKEIGIRKTLGASVLTLLKLLINNFMVLVGISFVIAIPVAWYVTDSWLSDFQYRIQGTWALFVAVGVLIIVIALLTVGVQALRAATKNPIKAIMRGE